MTTKKSFIPKYFASCCRTLTLTILALILSVGVAAAHKFFVTAWVEEGSVLLEAAFGDGSLANKAEVIVYDEAGAVLLESKTNERGEFSYKIEKKAPLKIRVKAGMGHQDEVVVPMEEIEQAFAGTADPQPAAAKEQEENATVQPATAVAAEAVSGLASGLTKEEIQQVVEDALNKKLASTLDKKLRPIIRKLAGEDDAKKPNFTDILGGIGYIIGLVGLGTYISYRRKQ